MNPQPTLCLTADPDFLDLALEELRAAAPDAGIQAELEPGLLLVEGVDFVELAARWGKQPPIFVRHICPVMAVYPLASRRSGYQPDDLVSQSRHADSDDLRPDELVNQERHADSDDLQNLQTQIVTEFGPLLDPSQSFSIQTRIQPDLPYKPFDINKPISAALATSTGAPLDVRNPTQILSILITTNLHSALPTPHSALVGLSLPTHNLSNWAGGKRRFAREKGQISRAEFKLLEALETFGIELPSRGVALDLGASPGGWTRVLRQREQYVTAIDPGALDPRMAADPRVRHLRLTAEAYLAAEPDQFDLIVNDMRMDARDSARLMVDYADQLYAGGIGIMTLKLPEYNRTPILHHAFNILRQVYEIAGARHLFHNRSEITVYLRK